jgi:hypothetical protein
MSGRRDHRFDGFDGYDVREALQMSAMTCSLTDSAPIETFSALAEKRQ